MEESERKRLIALATAGKKRVGQVFLVKHLQGKRLTQRQAILAKCYECNGLGEDTECYIDMCPIHPYSPYKR